MTTQFKPCSDHVALMKSTHRMLDRGILDREYTAEGAAIIAAIAKNALPDAKIFDFTTVEDDDGLFDFAGNLVTHGLFLPPFDVSFFLWDDPVIGQHGDKRRAFALSVCAVLRGKPTAYAINRSGLYSTVAPSELMSTDNRTIIFVFGGSIGLVDGEKVGMFQDAHSLVSFDSGAEWTRWKEGSPSMGHASGLKMLKNQTAANEAKDTATTSRRFLSYCGLLNTRGVTARRFEPKKGLAEKRVRDGKLPWLGYSVIDVLKPSMIQSGDGANRSSPRAHYRRGHIRRLSGGTITTVSPCLVGAEHNGVVISSYVAKPEGMRA